MLLYSLTYVVQKIPQHAHVFFGSAVHLDPCHHPTRYPSSQRHEGSYKFYGWVSWSCFNCDITVTVNPQSFQPGKQVYVAVLIAQ